MAATLIIHPGFHKTGTTALQSSLSANRKRLAAEGVFYPPAKGKTGHHRAALALGRRSHGWKAHGGQSPPEEAWLSLARQVRNHPGTAVVSSEFLIKSSDETIRRLARDTAVQRIEVVFTLRPLASILPSAYQQSVKSGRVTPYAKWLKEVLDPEKQTSTAKSFWMRYDYPVVIERWARVFGAASTHLIIADKRDPKKIFEAFSSILGLPATFLQPAAKRGLNRSLTWQEIELLRQINKSFKRRRGWCEYVTFVRGSAVRRLTNKPPLTDDDNPLQTPQWAVEKAQEIAAKTVISLQLMNVQVHGDLDSLTQANLPIGRNKATGQVSTKVAATMLLATSSARVLRRAKTKKLLAELSRRLRRILPKWLRGLRHALRG